MTVGLNKPGGWITLLAGAGILVSVVAIAGLAGDFAGAGEAWRGLQWALALSLVPLAAADHWLRFWRWHILLKRVSGASCPGGTSFLVFSAGSLLVFTPGRVGEVAKSVYAQSCCGISMAASLPVLVAERLGDTLVMALMAGAGLLLIGQKPALILAVVILTVAALVLAGRKMLFKWAQRLPFKDSRLKQALAQASSSQARLFSWPDFGINFLFGTLAWSVEILIYLVALYAAGVTPGLSSLLLSLAVFPLGSLAGSLSFLPAGIGVTEGGLVGLAVLFGGLSRGSALIAALLARAAILGVVALAGIVCLLGLHRKMASAAKEAKT